MIDQAYRLRGLINEPVSFKNEDMEIISITSGKGGTGKSFLAFYISQTLASRGFKTLLVEFDFNLGGLSFHLDLPEHPTLYDFFRGKILFDELPLKLNENFSIILNANGKLDFPQNLSTPIKNFFSALRLKHENYDYVIIDNGAGIGGEIYETLKYSSLNLIVTQPDHIAVMDAYVMIKLSMKNSNSLQNGVIINRCASSKEGLEAYENLNKAVTHFFNQHVELIGTVNEYPSCRQIEIIGKSNGKPNSNSPLLKEIELTVDSLITFNQLANSRHSNQTKI